MARIRTIKPIFWDDELVGAMTPMVRLTFVGLFSLADDEGRLPGRAVGVRNKLFAYDEQVTIADVEAALLELHNARRIRLYGDASQRYLEVVNFAKHQRIQKPQPSQYPAPGRHYPVLPIEGADEQGIPLPVDDQYATSITGKGEEGKGEGSVSSLRSSTSSPVEPTTGQLVVIDGAAPAPTKKRKPATKAIDDPKVIACFQWYVDLWEKHDVLAIDLTPTRANAIRRALKEHGDAKVAACIRGHHSNPWRHENGLKVNDIAVLLRPSNFDVGVELWAKQQGLVAAGRPGGRTSKDDAAAEVW